MDADDTDFADLNDKDMDEEKINRLGEPELVYERRRTKISSQRFEKIEQEVWLQDFLRQKHRYFQLMLVELHIVDFWDVRRDPKQLTIDNG